MIDQNDKKIVLIISVSSAIFVSIMYTYFNKWSGLVSYVDVLTTSIFFAGMWLMAKRKIESWIFWIIGDLISVPLYVTKGLAFTSFQYFIFTFIAIAGYYKWKSIYSSKNQIV
jgi:nicotinamide mononucleotide transporter